MEHMPYAILVEMQNVKSIYKVKGYIIHLKFCHGDPKILLPNTNFTHSRPCNALLFIPKNLSWAEYIICQGISWFVLSTTYSKLIPLNLLQTHCCQFYISAKADGN